MVADAGRHGASRDADEILCLPDGRLGFRVADPATGKRRPTSDYEEVKEVEQEASEAERRRLYYVAMTRAIDRLIVSGSIDPDRGGDESTPIGWVLGGSRRRSSTARPAARSRSSVTARGSSSGSTG